MSEISDAELYSLITNVYKPPKNFGFPKTERSFRFVWFEEFTWVCYFRWEDGAYCLPCVLFGHKVVGSSSLENLYRKPYRKWPTAVKTFKKHQNAPTRTHKKDQILLIKFLDEYRGKEVPINKVFDSTHKENIKKAREAITPIVDTLKLCGRQNIPLRGHKDSTKNHPEVGKSGLTNSANFVELLMYRVRGGDKTLENHLHNAPRNAKYTAPDIRNELMECCRDLIVKQLVLEVKESRYYSILADEATYFSMKEQLALIFRFVDRKNNIRQEFVSFLECSYGLSGQSLYRTIKEFLASAGIDISDCRGQDYDGAGAVAGKNQGLSVHGLRVNPKALYTHCSCHRLNLAVVASCGKQHVRNLMLILRKSHIFSIRQFHVKTALRTKYCCIAQNP